jgi:hypothetical protein
MIAAVVGALLLAMVLQASANTITVDFTVSGGGWVQYGTSPPFGLSSQPTISGDVEIDSTKSDWTAFIGIDWVTGKTWTLSNIQEGTSPVGTSYVKYGSDGSVLEFGLVFENIDGAENYLFSNNTVGIGNGSSFMDCNFCVSITSETSAPLPAALPLFATGLGAMGLLDWRRKRKAQATA